MVDLELVIRHRARRILIVCPASLQVQWRDQMRDKFGLDFRIVDSELMRDLRRKRGIHVNPWTHFPRLITSIDFLKRERPLRLFRETLPVRRRIHLSPPLRRADPRRGPQLRPVRPWQLCHRLAPHRGHSAAGPALRAQDVPHGHAAQRLPGELHGPAGTARQPAIRPRNANRHARNSSGSAMRSWSGGSSRNFPRTTSDSDRFPKRVLEALEVDYPSEEKAIHAALRQYAKLRQARADDHAEKFATDFVLMTLKKRLFSSPAAFAATLGPARESR